MQHYNVDFLNIVDIELQLINTKPAIKNKFEYKFYLFLL